MLFNSFAFLLFFPTVVLLFFTIPHRFRWIVLLAASCYFYMYWIPKYILAIWGCILIDYSATLAMGRVKEKEKRRKYLLLSLFGNLGLLFTFKYFNFFSTSLSGVIHSFGFNYNFPVHSLILPLGISFHTFQGLSYTIEVYKGREPERHFGIFALYVLFFPQLVAGPIERPQTLLPQFRVVQRLDGLRIANGLKLMLWGFFEKIVIADNLAISVERVYSDPKGFSGPSLIVATVLFALQIYYDFSGYCDIAIGGAQVMGFTLRDNFNRPYIATSISDFWRRWHMSLSTWFRDYVYIPLGGNRTDMLRRSFNILIVFLLSGMWHGANWTFVIWGALHGFYMICSLWTRELRERVRNAIGLERLSPLYRAWQVLITFTLVCIAWIFFRANTLSDAVYIVTHLFSSARPGEAVSSMELVSKSIGTSVAVFSAALMLVVHFVKQSESMSSVLARRPIWFRWCLYYAIILGIFFLARSSQEAFIYFQF